MRWTEAVFEQGIALEVIPANETGGRPRRNRTAEVAISQRIALRGSSAKPVAPKGGGCRPDRAVAVDLKGGRTVRQPPNNGGLPRLAHQGSSSN
uniref:Uncharacterized protein n=1 Tax=Rhodopseudomonas palustris (strain BisA53) TaxID=316055 RepID=Q07KI7_RHOP5